jgi:uncharacterized membrane protein (UPF0182 family)
MEQTPGGVSNPANGAGTGVTPTIQAGRASDSNTQRFDPYYTLFRAPGAETSDPSFVLVRPFVPFSRDDEFKQLQAFMTVSGDPDTYGQLTAYVLQPPLPDGPLTVASRISQRFNTELTLLDQAGSKIRFGDLQIVPTGQGLLYVRPWFSEGAGNPVPGLESVSVTYGSRSERGPSLSIALAKLFPGFDVNLGDREGEPVTPSAVTPGPSTPSAETPGSPEELLARAETLFAEAQDAKAAFDSKTYQQKIEQAYELVRQAAELATGQPITIDGGSSASTVPAIPPTTTSTPPTTTSA